MQIYTGGVTVKVEWTDENPEVREALVDAAPFEGDASLWGDELYFDAPVDVTPDETHAEVDIGSVAYWNEGNALCVFWGPTPASVDDEPRAAGPVAPVGRVKNVEELSAVSAGETVRFG